MPEGECTRCGDTVGQVRKYRTVPGEGVVCLYCLGKLTEYDAEQAVRSLSVALNSAERAYNDLVSSLPETQYEALTQLFKDMGIGFSTRAYSVGYSLWFKAGRFNQNEIVFDFDKDGNYRHHSVIVQED